MTTKENELNNKISHALQLQQDDKLDDAKAIFDEILKIDANNADALHGIGLLYAQRRNFKDAAIWLKKAVDAAPQIPGFHNNLGNAYKALNKAQEATRHYNEALRLKTPYPEARNNLGRLLYQQGLLGEAIMHLEKAVREDPEHVDAHYNLANCYIHQDRLGDASTHYREVLKLRPDHLGAMHNLGITLTALKNFNQAKPYLEKALEREPNDIDVLFHLGIIEASSGNLDAAMALYHQTLSIDPSHADAHHNLATVLLHQKKSKEALGHYEKALLLTPHNQTAQHMIQALKGEHSEQGAPGEYVRALFDQYAYSYDTHVKSQLEYQVPSKLRQALSEWVSSSNLMMVLDLGCGTGLCAPYFRDIAEKLIGVDLSPNMIEVAQTLKGYDKLIVQDILSYLHQSKDVFHLILAADVLVYFGALDKLFELASNHLFNDGFFAFSVEKLEEGSTSEFTLKTTGRYAHQFDYIQTLAQKYQLKVIYHEETMLRKQETEEVMGYLCVLQKS